MTAGTPEEYIAALPDDRREAVAAVRDVINQNLADGLEETMQYGMISWVVPLERYPDTYNGEALSIASLASQKNHMALYLSCEYANPTGFRERWKATGRKLDMGRSCVRFRELDEVALDVVAETIAAVRAEDHIRAYEHSRA